MSNETTSSTPFIGLPLKGQQQEPGLPHPVPRLTEKYMTIFGLRERVVSFGVAEGIEHYHRGAEK